MKNRPYYFEIKNLITQFMGAFNDIAIKRFDKDKVSDGEYVGVGFLYSPKQRVINDLLTASRSIPLPTISVSISRIARDAERVFNKLQGHTIGTAKVEDAVRKIPQPVPINISVSMSIIARYQSDIEQIISNFVPYCDPYIAVSWKLPTTENTSYEREIRTIIEWSGDLAMQYPIELANNQLARVSCDTTFTIKGWLFKQIDTSYNKIYSINTNFNPSLLDNECYVYNNTAGTGTVYPVSIEKESFKFNSRPYLKSINNPYYYINNADSKYTYTIYGENLANITELYLKSNVPGQLPGSSIQSPFNGSKRLSSYPSFTGVRINTYNIITDNSIKFNIPFQITMPGAFDVIAKNDAGYGILSADSALTDITPSRPVPQPQSTHGITAL